MARFFQSLFGKQKPTQPPATALRIQSALQGVPIPILLGGRNRLGCSLIWYGDFMVTQGGAGAKGGIAGGKGQGGSSSGGFNYFASVALALCEGPVGNINQMWVNGQLANSFGITGTNPAQYPFFSMTFFNGTYSQDPWSFINAVPPFDAPLNYRGLAYAGFDSISLGVSPVLPQFTFEILSIPGPNNFVGQLDEDPAYCMLQLLTNKFWGLQFPINRVGQVAGNYFNLWSQYNRALGLLASPLLSSSTQASSICNDFMDATNSEAVWSAGVLQVVPRGDQAIIAGQPLTVTETHTVPSNIIAGITQTYVSIQIGNPISFVRDGGVTYSTGAPLTFFPLGALMATANFPSPSGYYSLNPTNGIYYIGYGDVGVQVLITYTYSAAAGYAPNTQPLYSFTTNDFLPNQATIGAGLAVKNAPLLVVRKPRDQMLNNIKVEYLDRSNNYNPVDIEVKDEASITAFGRERPSELKQWHFYCSGAAAQQAAALKLIKEQVALSYQWTCGKQFILLDPMDIVAVSDPGQGIVNQLVRITEIQENQDFSLTFTAEQYPGTFTAPQFGFQGSLATNASFNEAPGATVTPIIFEPTDALSFKLSPGGGLTIAIGTYGQTPSTWGGAQVWISYDNVNYQQVGTLLGPSRAGVTTASLATYPAAPPGQLTIDQTDTLSVNLSASDGTLNSATQISAQAGSTLCYVGGEVIGYATATLTTANNYNLTYLIRGAYGTTIGAHAAGANFLRLDNNVVVFPYDQSRIGSTIFIKLLAFNVYGGGLQNLSQVGATTYTIQGTALFSPLPQVQNVTATYQSSNYVVSWDQIVDFRNGIRYRIYSGSTFAAAVLVADLAHPPYIIQGDGTYWVQGYVQPVPNLFVYSILPAELIVSGTVLSPFVTIKYDADANNWNGTFTGNTEYDPSLNAARTGAAGNILTAANILIITDFLNFGSVSSAGSGIFQIPSAFVPDLGAVQQVTPQFVWTPTSIPLGQNVLTLANVLNIADFLGAGAGAAFVNIYPVIQIATGQADLFALPDIFAVGDIFMSGVGGSFGPWQKWVPGVQLARFVNAGMFLSTTDPNTIAYCLEMIYSLVLPTRIDHVVTNVTIPSGGQTFTFTPDTNVSVPSPTSSPFKGGPNGATVPGISVSWNAGVGAGQAVYYTIVGLTLSQMTIRFFDSTNTGVVANNVTIIAEGY